MVNQVTRGVGTAALAGVASNAPFAAVLEYAGKFFMVSSIPLILVGIGLYVQDVGGKKLYDQHTTVQQATVLEKIVEEDILNEGYADLSVLVDIAGEETVIKHNVRKSTFKKLNEGGNTEVVVPSKEILDYNTYKNAQPEEYGIEVVDKNYEKYWQDVAALEETMLAKLSSEQQEFVDKKHTGPQLKGTVDAELSMVSASGLGMWFGICILLLAGGFFCVKRAKTIKEKYGNLSANEIGNAKRKI